MTHYHWRRRVQTVPMVVLLVPLVAFILLCHYTRRPFNLLRDTECDTVDSLRTYAFILQGQPRQAGQSLRFDASLAHRSNGRVYLYFTRDSACTHLHAGDTVTARTRIRRGQRLGAFDYGMWLRRNGYIGTARVVRYSLRPAHGPVAPSLQQRLYARLAQAGLDGDEKAVVGALTLGCKEDLDPQLRRHFQASGAAHILAVSGLHTGIIYTVLMGLLTLGGRVRPMHENRLGRAALGLSVIAVMWLYAYITDMTPSVVRAVLMITLFETGHVFYRRAVTLDTIAAAAFFILLARPLDLWSVSFWLSFTATVAIVVFAKAAELFTHRLKWKDTAVGKGLNWLVGTVVISLAAQVGTLPVTLYCFGQFSTYFLLANILVLPLAALLVPCGMACIALGGSAPGLVAGRITHTLACLMNNAVQAIENLPGSTVHASADLGMVVLYYALLAVLALLIKQTINAYRKY